MANFTFTGIKLTSEGKKYLDELNKLMDTEVHVGFQAGDAQYESGADLVEIAAYNEYGTSDMPPRPFMQQSWENHEDELNEFCRQVNMDIINGGTAEDASKTLGVAGVGIVQQEIDEGSFAPNAPSTIAKKGSSHPLIDSATMRQSVKYFVKKG